MSEAASADATAPGARTLGTAAMPNVVRIVRADLRSGASYGVLCPRQVTIVVSSALDAAGCRREVREVLAAFRRSMDAPGFSAEDAS